MTRRAVPASIAAVLDGPLRSAPDAPALVGRSARLSYRELDAAADRVATALLELGVQPGHRLAVSLPNDSDIVVAFHAAMRVGAVWLGVNRNLAPAEKEFLLGDAETSTVLCDPDAPLDVLRGDGRNAVVVDAGDVSVGRGPWDVAADRDRVQACVDELDPYTPAGLAYTSGTTGRPKGVVHSQYNLLVPGAVLVDSRQYGPGLRKGDCLAFTILNLLVLSTLVTSQAGGCCVVGDRLDARGIAEWIEAEGVTTWNGVPAILSSMNTDPEVTPAQLASLDEVWTGGDTCPDRIREGFEAKFGVTLTGTYGLTEAPTVVSIDDRGTPTRPGASGRPLPHLAVSVRGPDGRELPAGEVGDIFVEATSEGPWAGVYRPMLGYLGHDEETRKVLVDGRLRTGDVGCLDEAGHLAIRSRRSALIIRGGANVYPAEVERVILEVDGVGSCAVFGVDDERLGQRVAAAVEPVPGRTVDPGAVVAACRTALARYKVPDHVTVIDQLPRNAMGKVERAVLPSLVDP